MKNILAIILISSLMISCSKDEHGKASKDVAGVTPHGNMPVNGSYNTCDYEDHIFGQFAYKVGNYNIQFQWNRYQIEPNHSVYYKIVIKDREGTGASFTTPFISTTHFTIHNNSLSHENKPLSAYFSLEPNKGYWVDIYSYDVNYEPSLGYKKNHIKRGTDIKLVYGNELSVAGFCYYKPTWY